MGVSHPEGRGPMFWKTTRTPVLRSLTAPEEVKADARAAFEIAAEKLEALTTGHPDLLVLSTEGGKWVEATWTDWSQGFLGGQLWLVFEQTGEERWQELARHYSNLVYDRQWDDRTHNLGLLIATTHKQAWELTSDAAGWRASIQAGRSLASRFDRTGRFLVTDDRPSATAINVMVNTPLVMWTGLETSDSELIDIARQHSATTRRFLVRGDGSTAHTADFEHLTGEYLRAATARGWRSDGTWSRGLALSIYGFTSLYALDANPDWLEVACLNARHWMRETTRRGDLVPPNDLAEPTPSQPWDSSSAAVVSGALFHLAQYLPDEDEARRVNEHALATFQRLASPEFLARQAGWEGVLKHAVLNERIGLGVDESMALADYFFLEAARDILAS